MVKKWLLPVAFLTCSTVEGKDTCYGYNYSCLPTCTNKGSLFLEGDVLFLQADGDGLGYATIVSEGEESNGRVVNHTKNYNLDFNWELAFRIGAGYTLPQNGWDIKGYWAHFYTIAKSRFHLENPPISTTVSTFWNTSTFNLSYLTCLEELDDTKIEIESQTALGMWRWNLDDFSLVIGKCYFPTNCFAMRPFLGLRGLSSRQSYQSDLNQLLSLHVRNITPLKFSGNPHSSSRCNFEGFGVQGGLEMRWFFIDCIDLFASFGISSIRGKVRSAFDETGEAQFVQIAGDINLNTLLLQTNSCSHFYDWKTIYDLATGFRVGFPICANRGKISLFAALEEHLFYNFNHFRPINKTNINLPNFTAPQGDLSLWGFSCGLMVDF